MNTRNGSQSPPLRRPNSSETPYPSPKRKMAKPPQKPAVRQFKFMVEGGQYQTAGQLQRLSGMKIRVHDIATLLSHLPRAFRSRILSALRRFKDNGFELVDGVEYIPRNAINMIIYYMMQTKYTAGNIRMRITFMPEGAFSGIHACGDVELMELFHMPKAAFTRATVRRLRAGVYSMSTGAMNGLTARIVLLNSLEILPPNTLRYVNVRTLELKEAEAVVGNAGSDSHFSEVTFKILMLLSSDAFQRVNCSGALVLGGLPVVASHSFRDAFIDSLILHEVTELAPGALSTAKVSIFTAPKLLDVDPADLPEVYVRHNVHPHVAVSSTQGEEYESHTFFQQRVLNWEKIYMSATPGQIMSKYNHSRFIFPGSLPMNRVDFISAWETFWKCMHWWNTAARNTGEAPRFPGELLNKIVHLVLFHVRTPMFRGKPQNAAVWGPEKFLDTPCTEIAVLQPDSYFTQLAGVFRRAHKSQVEPTPERELPRSYCRMSHPHAR